MDTVDWTKLSEQELQAFEARVALVETILDESIDATERLRIRQTYCQQHQVCERTIRNYLKRYLKSGTHGLLFYQRTKPPSPRVTDTILAEKLLGMMEENPRRSIPQLRRLLSEDPTYGHRMSQVSDRSVYRFFQERGLTQKARLSRGIMGSKTAFHRFEATCSMQLVQGDARDGIWLPTTPGEKQVRKTYLFAWLDDYSRKILHAQYFWDEKLPRMEETFKTMILRWGIPQKLYLDNGSVYIAAQFSLILADLGIKKIHHGPYQAWCKGKVESLMKTLKREFQDEAQKAGFTTLEELNSALWAWMDVAYNRRLHSSTGQAPETRFIHGMSKDHRRVTDLQWFENLFLLRQTRTVTKYGEIKLEGNVYHTTARHGSVVEVRFNPFDLGTLWRFEHGKAVETLGLKKLIHTQATTIQEERQSSPQEINQDAARYFQRLREQQQQLVVSNQSTVQFSKLKTSGATE